MSYPCLVDKSLCTGRKMFRNCLIVAHSSLGFAGVCNNIRVWTLSKEGLGALWMLPLIHEGVDISAQRQYCKEANSQPRNCLANLK